MWTGDTNQSEHPRSQINFFIVTSIFYPVLQGFVLVSEALAGLFMFYPLRYLEDKFSQMETQFMT